MRSSSGLEESHTFLLWFLLSLSHTELTVPPGTELQRAKAPAEGCTYLDHAGHRRNKESQDVSNLLLSNLRSGTQKKGLAERNHCDSKSVIFISLL